MPSIGQVPFVAYRASSLAAGRPTRVSGGQGPIIELGSLAGVHPGDGLEALAGIRPLASRTSNSRPGSVSVCGSHASVGSVLLIARAEGFKGLGIRDDERDATSVAC